MKKYLVTITIAFSLFIVPLTVSANELSFSDVNTEGVHYDAIMNLAEKGIIDGKKDGQFHPWEGVNRGQMAKMMAETKGLETITNSQEILSSYDDVNLISGYSDYIAIVTKVGIFKGENNTFGTYDHLTREQMATVLVRAFHLDKLDNEQSVDINLDEVGKHHRDAVQTVADLGITKELDAFHPYDKVTRAELSSFLDRTLDVKESVSAGTYKVGADIPAGEYLVFSPGLGYIEAAKDSTGSFDSIIFNDNVPDGAHSYVTLKKGEYFQLENAEMYPVDFAPSIKPVNGTYASGMYKVGTDIPAGEYKVTADRGEEGYVEVNQDSRHQLDDIVNNDNIRNNTYITVYEGQYLTLQNTYIEK